MRLAAGVRLGRAGGGGYSKLASTHIKTGEHLLSILGAQAARVGAALVLLCRRAAEVNPDFCGFVHQNKASDVGRARSSSRRLLSARRTRRANQTYLGLPGSISERSLFPSSKFCGLTAVFGVAARVAVEAN